MRRDNPGYEDLSIQMYYASGPEYWNLGHIKEFDSFLAADQALSTWGRRGEGMVGFAVYIRDELVYNGVYDLSVRPYDLKRQITTYLQTIGGEDAERLLGALAQQNPVELKRGYVDPDTGAWMSRRRFDEGLNDAVVSKTITEDPVTIDDINAALLAGTVGIGESGLVSAASRRRVDTGEGEPEPARVPHTRERHRRQGIQAGQGQERQGIDIDERVDRIMNVLGGLDRGLGRLADTVVGPSSELLSPERLQQLSVSHGLDLGGYEYDNVYGTWRRALSVAGISPVAQIEADTFGTEVMGSSRDFFGQNIHELELPVILFSPTGIYGGEEDRWPERLPGSYKLISHGYVNEYETECICAQDHDIGTNQSCPRCEGDKYLTHEGGDWALYAFVEEDEAGDEGDGVRRIVTTYQVVTPESAEHGDFEETGFEDEEGVEIEPELDEDGEEQYIIHASNFIANHGGMEASSVPFHPGTWYTEVEPDVDYSTGAERTRSFHLKNFTAEEEAAIYKVLTGIRDKIRRDFFSRVGASYPDVLIQLFEGYANIVLAMYANSNAGSIDVVLYSESGVFAGTHSHYDSDVDEDIEIRDEQIRDIISDLVDRLIDHHNFSDLYVTALMDSAPLFKF